MFKKDSEFTETEKLDYVFTKMRKQAKTAVFMTIFKFIVYGGIIYFYFIIVPNLDIDALAEKYVIPKMSKIVEATAKQTMQNVGGNLLNGNSIDPDLLATMSNGNNPVPVLTGSTVQNKRKNISKLSLPGGLSKENVSLFCDTYNK